MPARGFAEEQASYAMDDLRALAGQFRRLGPSGPAYENMDVDADGNVVVEIVYSSG